MRPKLFSFTKLLLGWPISIVSLFFIFKLLSQQINAIPKIQEFNVAVLLAAISSFFAYTLFRGLLWHELLKQNKYKLSFKECLKLWVFSEFKRYTPGNIWSLMGRVFSFESVGVKKEHSAKALLYEAELIVVGGLFASLFSLPVIFNVLPDSKYEILAQPLIYSIGFAIVLSFIFAKRLKIKLFPNFNYKINFKLTLISFFSLFFFGIGSYFTFSSIYFIDPRNFILLSFFSVFALLVGYLSLITPMGLGVREGVLLFGLSSYLTNAQAAVATVFARICFIFSELLFLFFIWLWNKINNKLLFRLEKFFENNGHIAILIIAIVTYVIYFTNTTFLRHDNFFTGRFDLGNMDQTVWNTIHGRIFELTNPNGVNIISRLSFHADFILVLISPLYFLWKDPKMLLLLQTIILSLGAAFVYMIGQKIINNKNFSLVLAFSYLINPAVNYSNLFDFHPVALATTFLLAAFYFLIKKNYVWLTIFLVLAGLTKEQVWIVTALFGAYIFVISKKRILGMTVFTISLFLFYYLLSVAIPNFSGGKHFALSYYSDFGDSPVSIIKNALTDPVKTLVFIFQNGQLDYLKKMLLPFSFLPIFSPLIVFSFPDLFLNLLSNNSQLHEIVYQYTAVITPFLFISTIYAIRTISKYTPNLKITFYTFIILVFSLYSAYDFGPLPGAKYPNVEMYNNQLSNWREISRILEGIPKRYSIASTNNLGAHLSHRQRIYTIPQGVTEADIILFLIRDPESNFAAIQEHILLLQVEKNSNFEKFVQLGQFTGFKKKNVKTCFVKQALSFRNCPPYSR